ncbi:MAG: mannose-1-phosphate guanylyltransferase [bacterium]|nr:mannose-1-phosphate guanylyltransferase [bacterium]
MTLTAIIMAGGRGERFWPKSRKKTPKQTLTLFNGKPLICSSIALLTPLISQERIFIVTEKSVAVPIRKAIPDSFPQENIIIEPMGRNTAACIGLATAQIIRKYPDAVIAVLCADHLIPDGEQFRNHLQVAIQVAEQQDYLVTFGLTPGYPETGFGYIESGEEIDKLSTITAYRAVRFVEKPDKDTAEKYVESGKYFWNSGMFVWRAQTIMEQFRKLMPALYQGLQRFQAAIGTPQEQRVLRSVYRKLEKVPIDKGIMEKADRVAMVKSDFTWFDIGSWLAIDKIRNKDEQGNVYLGNVLGIDTQNCIIVSDRPLIATIGVENMVIVATKDAILVCPKDRAQEVKKIVSQLESSPAFRRYL